MASFNKENHMILIKTKVRNVIWFHKKSPNKFKILNIECSNHIPSIHNPHHLSTIISYHLVNILLTVFIQVIYHFIETCIYRVIHLLVLTLALYSTSDPLSNSNLTVSKSPPPAAFIRTVTPAYRYDDEWIKSIIV